MLSGCGLTELTNNQGPAVMEVPLSVHPVPNIGIIDDMNKPIKEIIVVPVIEELQDAVVPESTNPIEPLTEAKGPVFTSDPSEDGPYRSSLIPSTKSYTAYYFPANAKGEIYVSADVVSDIGSLEDVTYKIIIYEAVTNKKIGKHEVRTGAPVHLRFSDLSLFKTYYFGLEFSSSMEHFTGTLSIYH